MAPLTEEEMKTIRDLHAKGWHNCTPDERKTFTSLVAKVRMLRIADNLRFIIARDARNVQTRK